MTPTWHQVSRALSMYTMLCAASSVLSTCTLQYAASSVLSACTVVYAASSDSQGSGVEAHQSREVLDGLMAGPRPGLPASTSGNQPS